MSNKNSYLWIIFIISVWYLKKYIPINNRLLKCKTTLSHFDFYNLQVCGHRYLDSGDSGQFQNPYGVCYISGRNLSGFQRYDPCPSQLIICEMHKWCMDFGYMYVYCTSIFCVSLGTVVLNGKIDKKIATKIYVHPKHILEQKKLTQIN